MTQPDPNAQTDQQQGGGQQAATGATGSVIPPAKPADQQQPAGDAPTVEKLQAEVERLRRENGSARVTAKQQAANEARTELAQEIARVLGIDAKDAETPEQLKARIAEQDQEVKAGKVQLAVYQLAASVTPKADAVKLLSWKPFLDSISKLDPTDSTALQQAMTEAVKANSFLSAAPVAGASAAQHAGGSSGNVPTSATAAPGQARMQAAYGEAAAAH